MGCCNGSPPLQNLKPPDPPKEPVKTCPVCSSFMAVVRKEKHGHNLTIWYCSSPTCEHKEVLN